MSTRLFSFLWACLLICHLAAPTIAKKRQLDMCLRDTGLSPDAVKKLRPTLEGIENFYQKSSPSEQQKIISRMTEVLKKSKNKAMSDEVVNCVTQN